MKWAHSFLFSFAEKSFVSQQSQSCRSKNQKCSPATGGMYACTIFIPRKSSGWLWGMTTVLQHLGCIDMRTLSPQLMERTGNVHWWRLFTLRQRSMQPDLSRTLWAWGTPAVGDSIPMPRIVCSERIDIFMYKKHFWLIFWKCQKMIHTIASVPCCDCE